ncbi:MAG: hypothetical protein ACE5GS_17580 [Kiloniellaceae bacterium]
MNIAKGRVNELHDRVDGNDPAASALIVVLLKAAEVDATLEDYDDLGALLGAAGNTEADFTNYARKTLTDVDIVASVVDDVNNRREADIPDQTWTAAGGAVNNTLKKLLICYDADTGVGTDANIVPLCHYDFAITTNGGDLTAQVAAAGYFRAS